MATEKKVNQTKKTTTSKKAPAKKTTTAAKKPVAKNPAAKTTAKKTNTTKNSITSPEENLLLDKLTDDQKVVYLKNRVRELEEENIHLVDRVHHFTSASKTVHKSAKIKKEIVVDSNEPFNSLYGDRKSLNARKNFWVFFDLQFHSILKNKLMWILLFALPMIFTMLFHVILSLGAATEGLIPGVPEIDTLVQETFATQLANILSGWLVAIPMVVFPCIILPTFLISSRENNLLKRLTINSVNRSQLFWFYMLSSFTIFLSYLFVMFIIWNSVLNLISNVSIGTEIWDSYSSVYHMAGISVTDLLVEAIVLFMGLSGLGFLKAMKVKESKNLVAWGTGMFIFCEMTKLSISIVDMHPYLIELDASEMTNFIIATLLFMIKYMFIFSPVTWAFVAISTVSRGPSKWSPSGSIPTDEFDKAWSDNPEAIFITIQLIAILICLSVFAYVWYNKEKIIILEASR